MSFLDLGPHQKKRLSVEFWYRQFIWVGITVHTVKMWGGWWVRKNANKWCVMEWAQLQAVGFKFTGDHVQSSVFPNPPKRGQKRQVFSHQSFSLIGWGSYSNIAKLSSGLLMQEDTDLSRDSWPWNVYGLTGCGPELHRLYNMCNGQCVPCTWLHLCCHMLDQGVWSCAIVHLGWMIFGCLKLWITLY